MHLGLRLLLQEMQGLLDSQEQKEQEQGGMGEVRRKNMELVEIDLAPPLKEKLVEWAALIDDVEESTDRGTMKADRVYPYDLTCCICIPLSSFVSSFLVFCFEQWYEC